MSFLFPLICLLVLASGFSVANSRKTRGGNNKCNKTLDLNENIELPEVTSQNFGLPLSCQYRFRSGRGSMQGIVLRVNLIKFKVGKLVNNTYCKGGYVQILDGNSKTTISNRNSGGKFCGEIEQSHTFISETPIIKIIFHTDNFNYQVFLQMEVRAEQQHDIYLRYGNHAELHPTRRGEIVEGSYCERIFRNCQIQTCFVQSPGFPGIYPKGVHCRYHLSTRTPFIKLYMENEEFNVDGQWCENLIMCPIRSIQSECPNDYIKVYDGTDEYSTLIGSFCGMGKFPFSIIGTGKDLFIEFVTSPAGPPINTGFHFNVLKTPGHLETAGSRNGTCDWVFRSRDLMESGRDEGIFLSLTHWYTPGTSCSYRIKGERDEIIRLYFPSFRINSITSPIYNYQGDCGESLTIYDSSKPDDAKIIKTFCDSFSQPIEKEDFLSSGNELFVRFYSKTGSYSGSSIYYWAHYDFFNSSHFGDFVPGTLCDESFYSRRSSEGLLKSPVNTLLYKNPKKIKCKYSFLTDRSIYARVMLRVLSVKFKYNENPSEDCWNSNVDKLYINDPLENRNISCFCKDNQEVLEYPQQFVSIGPKYYLVMEIDKKLAIANYFKSKRSIFEVQYKFVHNPLCGPSVLQPRQEGSLQFPFFFHHGSTASYKDGNDVHCVWDLYTKGGAEVSIKISDLIISNKLESPLVLQVFQSGKLEPIFVYESSKNVSGIEVPQVTPETNGESMIQIHFKTKEAAKPTFIVKWSEVTDESNDKIN